MHTVGTSLTRPQNILTAGVLSAVFLRSHASADADAEREALARLVRELQALSPLIEAAESQANPDARIRLRYDWLRRDLNRIRAGMQEHIDAPRNAPRTFPPLRGDYRQ